MTLVISSLGQIIDDYGNIIKPEIGNKDHIKLYKSRTGNKQLYKTVKPEFITEYLDSTLVYHNRKFKNVDLYRITFTVDCPWCDTSIKGRAGVMVINKLDYKTQSDVIAEFIRTGFGGNLLNTHYQCCRCNSVLRLIRDRTNSCLIKIDQTLQK